MGGGCSRHDVLGSRSRRAGEERSWGQSPAWSPVWSSVGSVVDAGKQTSGLSSHWSRKIYFTWMKKLKYKKQVFKTLRREPENIFKPVG